MAAAYIETRNGNVEVVDRSLVYWWEKLCEGFWFTTCLVLFMILGPFAAPIVLGFIFSNNFADKEMPEPDSLN